MAAASGSSIRWVERAPAAMARLDEGPLLDVGDPRRRAHDHARMCEAALLDLGEEVAEHLLGHLEVGDHAVAEGSNRGDRRGGPPDHPLRLVADGVDVSGRRVDGDDRGLGDENALPAHEDQRVRGSQIDRYVAPACQATATA